MPGIERDRPAILADRFVGVALQLQRIAQIIGDRGMPGIELDRPAIRFDRRREVAGRLRLVATRVGLGPGSPRFLRRRGRNGLGIQFRTSWRSAAKHGYGRRSPGLFQRRWGRGRRIVFARLLRGRGRERRLLARRQC